MYFDRFDICAAFSALEYDYNEGGLLQERPSNQRRRESIGCQLARMKYSNSYGGGGFSSLETENAQEIYLTRALTWGLPMDDELIAAALKMFILEYLQSLRPDIFGTPVGVVQHVCQTCGAHSNGRWGVCGNYPEAWDRPFAPTPDCASHAQRAKTIADLKERYGIQDTDEDSDE